MNILFDDCNDVNEEHAPPKVVRSDPGLVIGATHCYAKVCAYAD